MLVVIPVSFVKGRVIFLVEVYDFIRPFLPNLVDEILKQIPSAKIKYVQKDDDPRDYRANFDKIKNVLEFSVSKTVPDGICEVKDIVSMGVIQNPDNQRYYNIPHKNYMDSSDV